MSRNKVSPKPFALLACTFLLLASIGCNPGTLTGPSSAPQNDVVEDPNFIYVLSTPKGDSGPERVSGASKVISAESGGFVACGPFTLSFPPKALDEDTEITMEVLDDGTLGVELGPHGIQFNVPVVLSVDLTGTTAEGMADQTFTLWHDENNDQYLRMPGLSPYNSNTVRSLLEHFSRYKSGIGA